MAKHRSDSVNQQKTLLEMQKALLGLTVTEASVLNNLKFHLDQLMTSTYQNTRAYQKTFAQDAMITDEPLSRIDEGLVEGITSVTQELNEKNEEIKKLQRLLALLGVEVGPTGAQTLASLRQALEELNKRNRILRAIQSRIMQHPLISGQVPKGVTENEVNKVLVKLNDEITLLNQTNFELKQQIKMNRMQSPQTNDDKEPQSSPSKRGPR